MRDDEITASLEEVARAQSRVVDAHDRVFRLNGERDQAVRAARKAGASLGQLARAMDMTRSGVQAILRKIV